MGLDITAYRTLILIDRKIPEDMLAHFYTPSRATYEWVNREFPGRTAGMPPVTDNCIFGWGERYDFRAGSYSNYGQFRSFLARLGGFADAEDCWNTGKPGDPFYELVNFADNEGMIGPEVSAKLLADFREFDRKALAEDPEHQSGWYYDRCQAWRRAFELASHDGCVAFH